MFDIKIDSASLQNAVNYAQRQITFACAAGLSKTVKDIQDELRQQLPDRFTIRTSWVARGIQISTASKANLSAAVRVMDPFMEAQETGGLKRSQAGRAMGIPVGARATPTDVTRPTNYPGRMLQRPGYFIAPLRTGSPVKAVWRRIGKGKTTRVKLMYVFSHAVRIKPRFEFVKTATSVALRQFPRRFAEVLQSAL